MSVTINFTCNGVTLNESSPLDFGTVQAGTASALKTIAVTNTGDSNAMSCVIEAKAATVINGFSSDLVQSGIAQDTFLVQTFAENISSTFYSKGVLGTGKNFATGVGGTLLNTTGSDTIVTKWEPPSGGTSGVKVWGNVFSCVYV